MPLPFKKPRPAADQSKKLSSNATTATGDSDTTFSTIESPGSAVQRLALLKGLQSKDELKSNPPQRFKKDAQDRVEYVFRMVFKKAQYKGHQESIMKAALLGCDVLVIAPTGMGKSLCFQVPAIADLHGLTLVVSPLLSLMTDQIQALRGLGVKAAMLSSKSPKAEQEAILDDMQSGHPKNRLLYITPERLSSPPFRKRLIIIHKQKELNRLVIDEAHCISEWGHDFRPDYAKLGNFRADFPKVPIMALTASATPKVQDDIVNELGLDLEHLLRVVHPFNRLNLFYEIRYFSESTAGLNYRQDDILAFIQKISRSSAPNPTAGIIYCRAKKTCDELARFLRGQGVMAAAYHRGLKDTEADLNQTRWLENDKLAEEGKARVDCIVATIAFGMGIDKPNCRYVIHYDIPKSFEGFYQETGRAGRDGHAARCLMYYSPEDKIRIESLVENSHASRVRKGAQGHALVPSQRAPKSNAALLAFAEEVKTCRHISICRYFGEKPVPGQAAEYCSRMCDVCKDPVKTRKRRDDNLVSLDFQATQAVVERLDDPDDWEQNDDERASDEDNTDEENNPQSKKPRYEGFRTAATEHGREREKDREASKSGGRSKESGSAEVIQVGSSDDEAEAPQDVEEVEDLMLPPPVPARRAPPPPRDARKELSIVPVQVSTSNLQNFFGKLPPVGVVGQPSTTGTSFTTPFLDPTRNASYRDSGLLKSPPQPPSSISEEPLAEFDVAPLQYEKSILPAMRRDAVTHFAKHLARGLFSDSGRIRASDERLRWKTFGVSSTATRQHRLDLIRTAALELESDLFWSSTTPIGYRQFFARTSVAVKSDPIGDEAVDALKRAVVADTKGKKKAKKRPRVQDDDDDE